MNSILIDVIFVAFLLIMSLYGYKKGFITRLYDIVTLILVIFLTCVLAGPMSSIFQLYQYNQSDFIATIVGTAFNYFIVFIVLFIGLFIIKKIIGIFVKPVLKKLMDKFSITSFVDKLLGVIVSFIEGIILSYIALVFVFIPFYDSGYEILNDTVLSKQVVRIVPDVTENVIKFTQTYKDAQTSSFSLQSLTEMMLVAQNYQLLSDEQIKTIVDESIAKELKDQKISLSNEQKQQIADILSQNGYNKEQIDSLLSNINVSGE